MVSIRKRDVLPTWGRPMMPDFIGKELSAVSFQPSAYTAWLAARMKHSRINEWWGETKRTRAQPQTVLPRYELERGFTVEPESETAQGSDRAVQNTVASPKARTATSSRTDQRCRTSNLTRSGLSAGTESMSPNEARRVAIFGEIPNCEITVSRSIARTSTWRTAKG